MDQFQQNKLQLLGKLKFRNISKYTIPDEIENSLMVDIASWKLITNNVPKNVETKIQEILSQKNKLKLSFHFGSVIFPFTNETLELVGELPIAMPLGCLPEQDLDLKEIQRCQERCNGMLEALGILRKESENFKRFVNLGVPIISTVHCPGIKLEEMEPMTTFASALFILSGIWSNPHLRSDGVLTINQLTKAVGIFTSVLLEGNVPKDMEERDAPGFPKFLPLCSLLKLLRDQVISLGRPQDENKYFFESFVEYMEACTSEIMGNATVDDEGDHNPKLRFYYERKKLTIGLTSTQNLACLIKDIRIPVQIRRDPLFKMLHDRLGRQAATVNDIYSLKKEIANGETSNIILLRNLNNPADVCFKKALADAANFMKDVFAVEIELSKKFPDDHVLGPYFEMLNIMMDANLRCSYLCGRYNHSGTFELIVSQNE